MIKVLKAALKNLAGSSPARAVEALSRLRYDRVRMSPHHGRSRSGSRKWNVCEADRLCTGHGTSINPEEPDPMEGSLMMGWVRVDEGSFKEGKFLTATSILMRFPVLLAAKDRDPAG